LWGEEKRTIKTGAEKQTKYNTRGRGWSEVDGNVGVSISFIS
jgi:hypothetical protein